MKTSCLKVNVRSAKTKILLDGAIILTVNLNFLPCKEIPDYLLRRNTITITCFYLCVDNEKVLLTIFSVENSLVYLCITETISIIGLYLCVDNEKELLIIFSVENSLVYLCMTETLAITGLYLCVDNEKVSLIIFSVDNRL